MALAKAHIENVIQAGFVVAKLARNSLTVMLSFSHCSFSCPKYTPKPLPYVKGIIPNN